MRVLLHDYTGHAFQADLARQLASLGHTVLHLSCASFPAPKGLLCRQPDDPSTLDFKALEMAGRFSKYDYFSRWRQEKKYGRKLSQLIGDWHPDILLICNTPLDPLARAFDCCESLAIPKVFWLQDLYSAAIRRYLMTRWWGFGRLIGWRYEVLEAKLCQRADALVPISEGFLPEMNRWRISREKITLQPNWAAVNETPQLAKDNAWSRRRQLYNKTVLLYAGTLGLKHDPKIFLKLAQHLSTDPNVSVVVVSEGDCAEYLSSHRLNNLIVLPFQPVQEVPEMLASADVLLSSLEPGAGVFCVPSKILNQLCAGRSLLAALPADNDAARMIRQAEAGIVVTPENHDAWLKAAERLVKDKELRSRFGKNARAYAEQHFDSRKIAKRFEHVLQKTIAVRGRSNELQVAN